MRVSIPLGPLSSANAQNSLHPWRTGSPGSAEKWGQPPFRSQRSGRDVSRLFQSTALTRRAMPPLTLRGPARVVA
jgi:hypothetical protein